MRRLQADHDNVSAAIDWALRRDPEVAVRLTSALAYFWLIGRRRSEVRQRLAEAVETARGASPASLARALIWAAQLANVGGRPDQAAAQAREAHELAKDAGDPWWVALCEAILGSTVGFTGEIGRARELLEASRARFEEIGDDWGAALAACSSAMRRRRLDDEPASQGAPGPSTMPSPCMRRPSESSGTSDCAMRSPSCSPTFTFTWGTSRRWRFSTRKPLDLAEDVGARDAVALARSGPAMEARHQGHYGRARELHLQALSVYREAGLAAETAHSLASLGYVEELRGDLDAAEACHQEAARRRPPTRPPAARPREANSYEADTRSRGYLLNSPAAR